VSESFERLNEMDESELRDLIKRAEMELRERGSQRMEELRRLAREAGFEVTLTKIGDDTGTRRRGKGKSGKEGGDRRRNPVRAKYRNPDNPSETWSGRGRQPKWVQMAIAHDRKLEDLAIPAQQATEA
jgi:DNA-binding protein H-NS